MNTRLQQFLSAENISQAQFADSIQVARASVSHILAGRNKPGYEFIASMIRRYPSLNPDWLITGKGKMYRSENPATKTQGTENEVVTEHHSPKVIEVPIEEDLLFPNSETVSLPAGYVHKDVKPAEFEAQKTRTTGSNTLNKVSETPTKQRKAVKIIVLYDDGSYQEM